MRLLCELFAVAVLVWIGWNKSFHDWTNQARGVPPEPSKTAAAVTADAAPQQPAVVRRIVSPPPQPTRSGEWMWDTAHRGTLDRPAYGSTEQSQSYRESGQRHYWIDAQGNRHYESATPPPGK
ncbi:MAG: hypothetical protein ABI839_07715 [Verrucomicrobiota bacterium]